VLGALLRQTSSRTPAPFRRLALLALQGIMAFAAASNLVERARPARTLLV